MEGTERGHAAQGNQGRSREDRIGGPVSLDRAAVPLPHHRVPLPYTGQPSFDSVPGHV